MLLLVVAGPAWAGGISDRMWFGGGFGLGLGDVNYVAVEPLLGISVTQRFSVGAGLIFRYREDDRGPQDFSSTDYGGNLFVRYRMRGPLFLEGDYERLSYEFQRIDGTTDRDTYTSVLAGPGFSKSVGGRTSVYAVALYNFDYDGQNSPYDDPWVLRVGVGIGF